MAAEAQDFMTNLSTAPFDYDQLVQMMAPLAGDPTTAPIANWALAKMKVLMGGWKDYLNKISGTLSQATGPANDQLRQAALAYKDQVLNQANQVTQMVFPYMAQKGLMTPQIAEKAREFDQSIAFQKQQNTEQYGLLQRQMGVSERGQTLAEQAQQQQNALLQRQLGISERGQSLAELAQQQQNALLQRQAALNEQAQKDKMAQLQAGLWANSMAGLSEGGIHPSTPASQTDPGYSARAAKALGLSQPDQQDDNTGIQKGTQSGTGGSTIGSSSSDQQSGLSYAPQSPLSSWIRASQQAGVSPSGFYDPNQYTSPYQISPLGAYSYLYNQPTQPLPTTTPIWGQLPSDWQQAIQPPGPVTNPLYGSGQGPGTSYGGEYYTSYNQQPTGQPSSLNLGGYTNPFQVGGGATLPPSFMDTLNSSGY